MQSYECVQAVHYDGLTYYPGELVKLPADIAKEQLDRGAVVEAKQTKASPKA